MVFTYQVTVTNESGAPEGGVNIKLTGYYSVWAYQSDLGYYQWELRSAIKEGSTNASGFVSLTVSVDISEYYPDDYRVEHMMVEMIDPDYTVLSSQNTFSYFTNAAGSFLAIQGGDSNGNGIPDQLEILVAEKFAPVYKFHQNNPLFPMPVEAVYGINHPTIVNNSSLYLPLPIAQHNDVGWNNFFYNVLKPSFDNGAYHPTVYFRIFRQSFNKYGGGSETYHVIHYWCYYPYDDAANVHEGDWEHIDLLLDDLDLVTITAQPVGAVYYRHNTVKWHNWNQLEVISGTHPTVYVGGNERVRLIGGGTLTRNGHEITGASYAHAGMHYSVDFDMSGFASSAGVVFWRADEYIAANRTLNYNEYDLVNMDPPLWWMGYFGLWGADANTVRVATPHDEINISVSIGGEPQSATITWPVFSDPPQSPPFKQGRWLNMATRQSPQIFIVYGPEVNELSSQLIINYTLLASAEMIIKIYTPNTWELVREFNLGIKPAGTYDFICDWRNNHGNVVDNGAYSIFMFIDPANLFSYFYYHNVNQIPEE